MMDCTQAKILLGSAGAGGVDLAGEERAVLEAHLATCDACRRLAAVERALTAALELHLPRVGAPVRLRRGLQRAYAPAPVPGLALANEAVTGEPLPDREAPDSLAVAGVSAVRRPAPSRRPRVLGALLAGTSAGVAAAAVLLVGWAAITAGRGSAAADDLLAEAVNDHLRVVSSTHPVEIEGGGIHQVRPWFTGRLDFAPPVAFSGDTDFPLVGGSIGYVHDRKAAVFSFRRRLHAITLLVVPAEGLAWPERDLTAVGRLSMAVRSARGFNVLLWRARGFGYALVSDVNRQELEHLAAMIDPDGQ